MLKDVIYHEVSCPYIMVNTFLELKEVPFMHPLCHRWGPLPGLQFLGVSQLEKHGNLKTADRKHKLITDR